MAAAICVVSCVALVVYSRNVSHSVDLLSDNARSSFMSEVIYSTDNMLNVTHASLMTIVSGLLFEVRAVESSCESQVKLYSTWQRFC